MPISSSQRHPLRRVSTLALWVLPIVLLVALIPLQRQRLATLQDRSATDQSLERQDQATAAALTLGQKMPTFGFDNLAADWFFLRFLQYFGDDEARAKTGYGLSPEFFKAIIPNDPYYRMFYLFLSGSTSNFAVQPEQSVAITAQGLERLTPTLPPDSFYIWRYRGVDELLYLGDGRAAQRSYQTAADWARQSPHPEAPYIAENSQRTADFLAQNPLSKQAQVNAWASVLGTAFDDATRQRAIDRINALGGSVFISETGEVSIRFPPDD
ncbi:hypothetical protein VB780_23510 [Leptolyngbya sp. CCNP1308]|uniref:hypothetical protein n=1 Tax=Leptolyngbya sp. CCNP1308 TaxID=3110255 RepID=UPI002B1FF5A4|nr:hypothetical protein [Leptolyngbya sp. CCNP1308]MEA5451564.1 hypothetical protein [Leptolyngbya sp. CCNP1308]